MSNSQESLVEVELGQIEAEETVAPSVPDVLAKALYAAEMGDSIDLRKLQLSAVQELFSAVPELRTCVAFALMRLCMRLCGDERAEVRAGSLLALGWLVELFPVEIETQLLALAHDPVRRVRNACVQTLSVLLQTSIDRDVIASRFRDRSRRVRDVLARAERELSVGV